MWLQLLYDTFSAFGMIVATPKIMRDPETGASRGFGFVSYESFEASDAAIEAMNGQFLCNRCNPTSLTEHVVVVQLCTSYASHNNLTFSTVSVLGVQQTNHSLLLSLQSLDFGVMASLLYSVGTDGWS